MIYITTITRERYGDEYSLYDTHTDSVLNVGEDYLKYLISRGIIVANVVITEDDRIGFKDWPNGLNKGKRESGILLYKTTDNRFKVVSYFGVTDYITEAALKQHIGYGKIGNCRLKYSKGGPGYFSMDTMDIVYNKEFEDKIEEKYNTFVAKSKLLGRPVTFDYYIEGTDVKITKYTGDSKKVVLPDFVTTICEGAFRDTQIESISLNEGLKFIGAESFDGCKLTEVVIPATVEYFFIHAFSYIQWLLKPTGEIDWDKIKLLNKNTIVLNERNTRVL